VAQALLPVLIFKKVHRVEAQEFGAKRHIKDTKAARPGAPNTRGFRVVGWEARIAETPASGRRAFQEIDTVETVWSEATHKGNVGGEAGRIAEPPASGRNMLS